MKKILLVLIIVLLPLSVFAYTLTTEEKAILAHVVVDPQAWADHAEKTVGKDAVKAKIEKYKAAYMAEKDNPDYKTRAERVMENKRQP